MRRLKIEQKNRRDIKHIEKKKMLCGINRVKNNFIPITLPTVTKKTEQAFRGQNQFYFYDKAS